MSETLKKHLRHGATFGLLVAAVAGVGLYVAQKGRTEEAPPSETTTTETASTTGVVRSVADPVDQSDPLKADKDRNNILATFASAQHGDTVQLAEGEYWLSKTLLVRNFDGVFKGAGRDKTTVRTEPGVDFDVTEALAEVSRKGTMIFFDYNDSGRGLFKMSDMKILVTEPATPLFVPRHGTTASSNAMFAVRVINSDYVRRGWSGFMIPLDYTVERLDVIGTTGDPRMMGQVDGRPLDRDNSIDIGIERNGIGGAAQIRDAHVVNADWAINTGAGGIVVAGNTVENAISGIVADGSGVVVENNIVINNGSKLAALAIAAADSPDAIIRGNYVTGKYRWAINPYLVDGCEVTGNYLGARPDPQNPGGPLLKEGISTSFGAIAVEESNECLVENNRFYNVSGLPSFGITSGLGAIWIDGYKNKVQNNDYAEANSGGGEPGWPARGGIFLAGIDSYYMGGFNSSSRKNFVSEPQLTTRDALCANILGVEGNNVVGMYPGMCEQSITGFNQSNPQLLESMAEMLKSRAEAWDIQ